MNNQFMRTQLAESALDLDHVAKLLVDFLLLASSSGARRKVAFSAVDDDPLSFTAQAHRKTYKFELTHAIANFQGGEVLAGRYDVFQVDRNGDFQDKENGFMFFVPCDILFDNGASFAIRDISSAREWSLVQDEIERVVLGIAQADLPKFDM